MAREDEKEPTVGAPGVPFVLFSSRRGPVDLLLLPRFREGSKRARSLGYKSASDPNSTRDRLHRAIGRERVKYGHRPFRCPRTTTQTGEIFIRKWSQLPAISDYLFSDFQAIARRISATILLIGTTLPNVISGPCVPVSTANSRSTLSLAPNPLLPRICKRHYQDMHQRR